MCDVLFGVLDVGVVCVNVDLVYVGQQVKFELDMLYGDVFGVGVGCNWVYVNFIVYDVKDDFIIFFFCYQGIVKIGCDKQVKWILVLFKGWNKQLVSKLLKLVDDYGKLLICDENGKCKDIDFDFIYI